MGDTWYLDELFVKIQGRQQYLWRAVDEDGDEIDILMQSRRNRRAAIRQQERQMRRFKSAAHAQRFVSVHGLVQNLFRVGRHLLRFVHHQLLRRQAFQVWNAVTCAS